MVNFIYKILILHILFLIKKFQTTLCAISKHQIDSIPGWEGPLPSKTYSGYIEISNQKFFNYFFFESHTSPENAPVALWMQGGPGSSGFAGLFIELGPFNLNENSIKQDYDVPTLFPNTHTWNKEVNYLFFESPPYVGYSYCENECPNYDDDSAAKDNYEFILKFFEHYPEYKNNDFWLTGESYAGIYIPTLANEILSNKNDINFKGVMVGNGCNGINTIGGCGNYRYPNNIDFLHRIGQISTKSYKWAKEVCPDNNYYSNNKCEGVYNTLIREAGHHNYLHIYDECIIIEDIFKKLEQKIMNPSILKFNMSYDYPCFQQYALNKWANHPTVRNFFNYTHIMGEWQLSSFPEKYTRTETDVFPYYKKMMENDVRILLYFGDVDIDVPFNGGQQWIDSLGMEKTKQWRPWTMDGYTQVAGYYMVFNDKMTYLTIRGAGHMVPQYKPEQSYEMFSKFINNKPFSPFISNS